MISLTPLAIGVGYLLLCLLILASFVSAQTFEWIHLVENDEQPHIIILGVTITLTVAALTQLFRHTVGAALDKGYHLPNKTHPGDEEFADYIRDFLQSEFTLEPIKDVNIYDYVQTWVNHEGWLVPENASLSRSHREGAFRRLLVSLKAYFGCLEKLMELAKNRDELQLYKDETRENVATLYPGPTPAGMDRGMVTPMFLRQELQRLQKLSDYRPLWDLAGNPSSDDKLNIDSSDLLARAITENILSHLTTIWNAIPPQYRVQQSTTPGKLILDSIRNIERSLNKTRTDVNRMSGVITTPGSSTTPPHLTLQEIWNELPTSVTGGSTTIPDTDEMKAILGQLVRDTKGKTPMVITACTHPEDLSTVLIGDASLDWPDSLQTVQDLLNRPLPTVPTIAPTTGERLFSSSDVPKLTDEDDYWTYRRSFEIFANAVTVTTDQIPVAVSRILNRFEGKRRDYMMAYDVGANLKPLWTPTWKAIVAYMDARFLDRDAHLELFKKWITLKPKDNLWGQSFIAEFDRIRMTLNQIAIPQQKTIQTDEKSLERLMDKLPYKVRNAIRHSHPNAEYQLLDDTDPTRLENIYDWIVDEWKYLHNQGDLKIPSEKQKPRSNAGQNVAEKPSRPSTPSSNWGTCNKPCWDTEPPINNGNRGKYRDDKGNIRPGMGLLCAICRRPEKDHGGTPEGCQHRADHRWHGHLGTRSGQPSGNDMGDE